MHMHMHMHTCACTCTCICRREPVVSEMFPTLSVVLTGLLGLWLTPTIAPVLLSSSSSGRGLVVVVVVVVV